MTTVFDCVEDPTNAWALDRILFGFFLFFCCCLSNSRSQITCNIRHVVVRFIFSSILQIQFVEVRISWSSSESPLDLEITRVDCNSACNIHYDYRNSRWQSCVRLNCKIVSHGYMYDYTTGPSCISIRILAPGSPMSLVSLTIGLPVVSSYSGPRLFESSILLKNTTISSEQVMWTVSWENVPSNIYAPNKDWNKPSHPRSLLWVFVVRMKKRCILGYSKRAQWRFWSDWANVQADLNLSRANMPKGTFSDVACLVLQGQVAQSVVSLTSSLRVFSLTVLADSIYNILILFCWKNVSAKATHIFSAKKNQHICVSLDVNFNESLTSDVVSFEQLGPDVD